MPTFLAVMPPGLEPVCARELADLGVDCTLRPGGVSCSLPLARGAALAAVLRTPARWQVEVVRGPARSLEQLAVLTRRGEWADFLAPGAVVEVKARTQQSRLRFRDAVEKKVAHAISDATPGRSRHRGGRDAALQVRVFIEHDEAVISVDCGGELLHRRGWRLATAKAPLRENLAAALLYMAGWQGDEALVDPFCGAGTMPIEAARMAAGLPPGVDRSYAFERFPACRGYRPPAPRPRPIQVPIVGADRDPGAIRASLENADRAGVQVDWRHCDVGVLEPPAPTGLVIANPPYGERVGGRPQGRGSSGRGGGARGGGARGGGGRRGGRVDAGGAYAAFGTALRDRFSGWRVLFLAPEERLARKADRAAEQLTTFSNGGIRVGVWVTEIP